MSISPDRTADRRRIALVAGSDRRNDDSVRSEFDRFLLGEQEMVRHHLGRQRQRVAKTPDQIDALLRRQRPEMDARAGLASDGAGPRDAKALRQCRARHCKVLHRGQGIFPVLRIEMLSFRFALLLQLGELCNQGARVRRDASDAAHVMDKLHEPMEFVIVVGDDKGRIAAVGKKQLE